MMGSNQLELTCLEFPADPSQAAVIADATTDADSATSPVAATTAQPPPHFPQAWDCFRPHPVQLLSPSLGNIALPFEEATRSTTSRSPGWWFIPGWMR